MRIHEEVQAGLAAMNEFGCIFMHFMPLAHEVSDGKIVGKLMWDKDRASEEGCGPVFVDISIAMQIEVLGP